ncbi:hypothetical protein C0638_20715 [Paenibacillus sp. lzh-N1]|nr:DUF4179 domain-containing protein [Paenibacillus sp. lzh-N1]AUO08793.1 hypothetical protein C0638_20715 [Paenibacillus sp. lzh-N1]
MNYHDPVDPMLKQFLKSRAQDLVIPNTVENAVGYALSSLSDQNMKKRSFLKRWRWAAAAVAFFFVLGAVSILNVPTFAEVFRSLFAKDNPDIGLMRAQELGLVINPHIKVKDKGYTLVINEAVADPTRVTIALQLFDENGKHDRHKLAIGEANKITIKDDKGNVVGSMYDMGYTSDFYYMVDFFSDPLKTDKITIEGSIGSLGQRSETLIKGNWDFSFDIDMKKANKQNKIEELEGSYTTPHGMTVTLKRLTRMVQGVRFELETELDDAAMTRSSGDLWKKQMLSFHFETTGGQEIHSVNPRKKNYRDSLMTSDRRVIGNGKMHWSYTFKYLPEDKPYRFVLDAYSVAEMDGNKISFRPSELTKPKTFKIMNDRLELVRASLEKSQVNKGAYETVISFYGKMDNEIMHEEWRAFDSAGKQYDVSAVGGSSFENTLTDHWREGYISMGDRRAKQPYEFRIMKLDQLTLVREVVDKRYKDPNWSVLLGK